MADTLTRGAASKPAGMRNPDWRRRRREVLELREEAIALRERLAPRRTRLERNRHAMHMRTVRV